MIVLEPEEKFIPALVGSTTKPKDHWERTTDTLCAVYSRERIIEILMREDGMDYDEASEGFDFNIEGAWMGEGAPTFVD